MSQWPRASCDFIGALKDPGSYLALFHNSSVTMDKSDSSRTKNRISLPCGVVGKTEQLLWARHHAHTRCVRVYV